MHPVECFFCCGPFFLEAELAPDRATCGRCRRTSWVTVFPAFRGLPSDQPPALSEEAPPPGEGEAVCFYAPHRRATHECGHCGVMISLAWGAHWGRQVVCLKCLEHLRAKGRDVQFQTRVPLWEHLVLWLALVPLTLVLYWTVFVTAPAAVFLALWKWNAPRSIVSRSRWRLVVGLILATIQILAVIFLIYAAVQTAKAGGAAGTRR